MQCCAKAGSGRIKYQRAEYVNISRFCLLLLPDFAEQVVVSGYLMAPFKDAVPFGQMPMSPYNIKCSVCVSVKTRPRCNPFSNSMNTTAA